MSYSPKSTRQVVNILPKPSICAVDLAVRISRSIPNVPLLTLYVPGEPI